VAGYLLSALGHLPENGESAEVAGRRLTVTQLDGRRISRVLVSPAARPAPDEPGRESSAGQAGPAH